MVGAIPMLGSAPVAFAQGTPSRAERLFEEGRDAMQRHDHAVACQKFTESNLAEPALGTQLNLANCEEQRGRVATAWRLFRQVREQLAPGDSRIGVAEEHIAALAARLPHLRISWSSDAPVGTSVRVDGNEVVQVAGQVTSVELDPGRHELIAARPGEHPEARQVELREAQTVEISVPFANSTPQSSRRRDELAPPQRPGLAPPNGNGASTDRTAAYVVGGVGVASLIAGAAVGIMGLHQESIGDANCSDVTRTCTQTGVDANNAARTLATVSSITLAVGIVGTGVGGYLYFAAAPPSAAASSAGGQPLSVGWAGTW